METNKQQKRAGDRDRSASAELHIDGDCRNHPMTYWGVLCRTCRELVALDVCPYISFGPGAAGMKPGAIRCGHGHNHIYFPRDFGFVEAAVIVSNATMQENREAYRAINPQAPTSYLRPEASGPEAERNHQDHGPQIVQESGKARPANHGTYQLTAKPYITAEGHFKGQLEGVMFLATSSTRMEQWFAINCGQFENDFCALVPRELAKEIVATLNRGGDINFPNAFRHEQFDHSFRYQGSPVHFILRTSMEDGEN